MNNRVNPNYIGFFIIVCVIFVIAGLGSAQDKHDKVIGKFIKIKTESIITPVEEVIEEEPEKPVTPKVIEEYRELKRRMGEVHTTRCEVILNNSYRMFITAYCAEECGWNYSTSSGEICHRSDWYNRYEPTTCAIDRGYFGYGTLFYIPSEDRVYIAEDTGSGVRGMWLDTYQDDIEDVYNYNTRYETVYTCEIEYYEVSLSHYDIRDMVKEKRLYENY